MGQFHTYDLICFNKYNCSLENPRARARPHYNDVIMTTMRSQVTSFTAVYSTVYPDADQRKHQSSASLAFVWGIHRDRWIPRTKGQLRGKCFHLMTSSWCTCVCVCVCCCIVLQFYSIKHGYFYNIVAETKWPLFCKAFLKADYEYFRKKSCWNLLVPGRSVCNAINTIFNLVLLNGISRSC